jgi:hypothetical protein
MKVFISWSGPRSKAAAEALREWLPKVIQVLDPFLSSHDIRSGTRGEVVIADELDETDFGVICVTAANQREPWLNYEAGALAKHVSGARVIPLALDLPIADIGRPLGQFQARTLAKADIKAVLDSLNEACENPLSSEILNPTFDQWWPELEGKLSGANKISEGDRATIGRTEGDKLDEVLHTVRALAMRLGAPHLPATPSDDERNSLLLDRLADILSSEVDQQSFMVSLSDWPLVRIESARPPSVRIRREATKLVASLGGDVALHET